MEEDHERTLRTIFQDLKEKTMERRVDTGAGKVIDGGGQTKGLETRPQ